ncbi:MAG TPA: hypothetical protein DDY14_10455 [Chromatiaceae bacterium]|nr:hypothetical protein [Chromatiaceae bacterium]
MELDADVFQLGCEFDHRIEAGQWHWQGLDDIRRGALPVPALRGRFQYDNASAAICAAVLLEARLPLAIDNLRQGLLRARLPGRFSVFPGEITWIFDVAHNADAAQALAANLGAYPCSGKRHAVLSLLADKDALAVTAALSHLIDDWHVAPAPGVRAMPVDQLHAAVNRSAPGRPIAGYADIEQAVAGATASATGDDCILVFGSFMAVKVGLRKTGLASV